MTNRYTQDMTGTGDHIETNEPERYYDWMLWRMKKEENKEANRLYYAVKGQLIPDAWSQKDIDRMYHQYTKRIWGNSERLEYTEKPFEKMWKEKYD
jgi:hypothetical protein